MKNNIVISIGCSFVEGIGCYNERSLKRFLKKGMDSGNLHYDSYADSLKGCLGTYITKKIGYDYHFNYGRGGSSIKEQLDFFYRDLEKFDFFEHNVFIYFGVTYPNRNMTYINGEVATIHTPEERNSKFYSNQSIDELGNDIIRNQGVYINSLLTLCILKKVPIVVDFIDYTPQKEKIYREICIDPDLFDFIVFRFKSWNQLVNDSYAHCGHPDKDGYKAWGSDIMDDVEKIIQIKEKKYPIFCKSKKNGLTIKILPNNQHLELDKEDTVRFPFYSLL